MEGVDRDPIHSPDSLPPGTGGWYAPRRPRRLSYGGPDEGLGVLGPGSLADSLAAYSTPVNLFRTLFRVLWGADEPPLEDRHYWSGTRHPMLLTEVALD